ncbi:MAG TPA: tyrosine-type recombinase/integrase [Candidatus Eremiobacteraceae bacterium]|nr:tyrosine-type recombinase/integrase [Candidatus Eremiobacteraceae bacterium]
MGAREAAKAEIQPAAMTNPATGRPDGRMHDWSPQDPLVIEFAQELIGMRLSPRTAREYARDVEVFGAFLQGRPLAGKDGRPYRGPFGAAFKKATVSSIRQFVMHLGAHKYGEAAIRRKLAVLRRFYKYCKREGYRPDNPAVEVPNIRLPKRLPKAIPVKDVLQLIGTRPEAGQPELRWRRDVAMLELLYASGMRRAELVGINASDVDFAERTIRVIGKGNKQRVVFFNHATADALRAYLRVRPRCRDGALFVSRQGRRLSYQQVGRVFAAYVKLSGLEGKITPHTMRHSVATHLHKSGVDLMTIKEFLGHESIQTTQIYAEMTLDHVRRSYEKHHPRDRAGRAGNTLRDRISGDE